MGEADDAYDEIDFAAFTPEDRYKFVIGAVVPRPIALVTTLSPNDRANAAPFSQFIILSSTPIILGFVVGRYPDADHRDTHLNILDRGECVINTVDEDMAEVAQLCAVPFARGESEPERLGLATVPSRLVGPPRLAVAPMAFECRLSRTERFGSTATLIAGEVVAVHARKGLVDGHRVDHASLRPLGRIAGRRYCRTTSVIEMPTEIDRPYAQERRSSAY